MALDSLISILTPPVSPFESGKGIKWPFIEGELSFPSDYIDFINTYGSGRIAEFIVIFNPFSRNEYENFFEQFKVILEDFNYLIASDNDYYKYQLYPKDNGLIPVGITDNGDYIFWVVNSRADSDLWRIAIIPARSPEVEYVDSGLVDFLDALLRNKTKYNSFPASFPPDVVKFYRV